MERRSGAWGWGRQTETKPPLVSSRPRPRQQPRNTDEESHCPQNSDTETTRAPGAAEARRSGSLQRERRVGGQGSERQEEGREQGRREGRTGLPGCQGPRRRVRLSLPLVGKPRRETGAAREPAPRPPALCPAACPRPRRSCSPDSGGRCGGSTQPGPAEGHTPAHQAWVSSLVKLRR